MATTAVPFNHNEPPTLDDDRDSEIARLAERWMIENSWVKQHTKRQHELEQELLPLLETKREGRTTHTTKHNKRIVCTTRVNRSVDGAELLKIRNQIPADVLPMKVKEVLDEPKFKSLQSTHPDFFQSFSRCVTSKPGKAHFKIEEV